MDKSVTINWQLPIETKDNQVNGMGLVWFDGTDATRHQIGPKKWEALAPNAQVTFHRDDVICCFNHDFSKILGRQSNNTLHLVKTDKGVSYSVDLNEKDTEAMSLLAKIDRRDVFGCSATFQPTSYKWSDDKQTILYDSILLIEIGPVSRPAMTASTIAADATSSNKYSLQLFETQKRLAKFNA